jgi:hypothetical protein
VCTENSVRTNHYRVGVLRTPLLPMSVIAKAAGPYLVREFHERFADADLLQLPNYRIYLKLMIDGTPSTPFSAVTLGP